MHVTYPVYAYSRGALRVWKRRRVFRMSAHFYGRSRNCYRIAIRLLCRDLRATSLNNKHKHADTSELYTFRFDNACREFGISGKLVRDALDRSGVLLSKQVLSNLAIWEPRTFKAIAHLGWKRAAEDGLNGITAFPDPPEGIITRGMLRRKY